MYVLILFAVIGYAQGGVAMTTQEFSSKDTCIDAGQTAQKLENESGYNQHIRWACVAK